METESTPQTSPTPSNDAPIGEVVSPDLPVPDASDIAAAGQKFMEETEGHDGLDGLTWDESGRAHRPDGSFATKAEVEAGKVIPKEEPKDATQEAVASEIPEGEVVEETAEEVTEDADAPQFKVVLKGQPERGEEDIELVLPDAESVERYNRAVNDGMRKKDYDANMAEVNKIRAEQAEWDTAMAHNPLGTIINAIPKDVQLLVTQALVAEHWDSLLPVLQQYDKDPSKVYQTRLDARDRTVEADKTARQQMEVARREQALRQEMTALVPESASAEVRARFLRDAESDVIDLLNRGVAVSPETVKAQLQDRVRMYGFVQDPAKVAKPVVARRVGDSTKAAPSVAQAKQGQARVTNVVKAQTAAKLSPPAGRGAVAVRKPLIPAGATIEEATAILLKQGGDFPMQ